MDNKWDWLPKMMPNVAQMVSEKRKLYGDAHVNECWRRGVIKGEPGWLFAREANVAVGTPWASFKDVALWQVTTTQGLLIMKEPEGHNGA